MSVFSGLIPTIKLGNGEINNLVRGTLSNVAISGLNIAVSKTFGADAAKALGLGKTPSNFLGSIASPGLISTGVSGLSQIIGNTITNSKALGPLGPLAGGILTQSIGNLGRDLTNQLFGGDLGGSNGTVYFSGAGGEGEEAANGSAYSLGDGGPDVVISIRYAANAAQEDAAAVETANPSGNQGTAGAPGGNGNGVSQGQIPASNPVTKASTSIAKKAAVSTAAAAATSGASTTAQTPSGPTRLQVEPYNNGQPAIPTPRTDPAPPTSSGYREIGVAASGASDANNTYTKGPVDKAKKPPAAAWKFICTPDDISWETTAQADRIPIFGANKAPVIAGVKGMRELTMSNAIVEGFCRNKAIEQKVILLEELMNMSLGPNNRYVQVPVYRVTANSKVYGKGIDDGGFYIIKSVKVQEKMRDLSGKATRAIVDISFTQVPSYQVISGRDIASEFLPSVQGPFEQLRTGVQSAILANEQARAAAAAKAAAEQRNRTGGGAPAAATPKPGNGPTPLSRPQGALRFNP